MSGTSSSVQSITLAPGEELVVIGGGTATSVTSTTSTTSSGGGTSGGTGTVTSGGTASTATPVGTVVTLPGISIYDGAGNAISIISYGGQIQLTPAGGQPETVTSSADVVAILQTATGWQQINTSGQIWTVAATNVPGTYVGTASATPPANSAVGATISAPGTPLYVDGQTYELTAGKQIQITPFSGTPFIVASSANVVSITVFAQSTNNPTGLEQLNTSGDLYTVAATNTAGLYIGPASATPTTPLTTPAQSTGSLPKPGLPNFGTTVYPAVGSIGNIGTTSLWQPKSGVQRFRLSTQAGDWPTMLSTISNEGQNGGICSKIPCPGSHLDWEYGNPEWEYYLDPSESNGGQYPVPFDIANDGSFVINCINHATPNANQAWLSGCISTAGNQGVFFAGTYGLYTADVTVAGFAPGFWPAKWELTDDPGNNGGNNKDFNYSLETDFEMWQNLPAIHVGMANSGDSGTFFSTTPNGRHQFITDYEPDVTTWYIDGQVAHTFPTPSQDDNLHPFMILNIAVGTNGSWAGTPPVVAGSSMSLTIHELVYMSNS